MKDTAEILYDEDPTVEIPVIDRVWKKWGLWFSGATMVVVLSTITVMTVWTTHECCKYSPSVSNRQPQIDPPLIQHSERATQ